MSVSARTRGGRITRVDASPHTSSGLNVADLSNARMKPSDYSKLLDDLNCELLTGASSVGILGATPIAVQLLHTLASSGFRSVLEHARVYTPPTPVIPRLLVPVKPFCALAETDHDVLVVAADAEKEDLLTAARPFVTGAPKVILAGYAHLGFRDSVFRQEASRLTVPSIANGYPNTLIHIYQCLHNAARLNLRGTVAEFGMFKGGTTMFLSRVIERLGMNWPVVAFDTFAGFPPRSDMLDMYDHPECIFTDLSEVQRYLEDRDVEIVPGDIVDTCHRLENDDVVLSFIDTDNYTPAVAALQVVQERTVPGGAIVFDHFTGVDRFRYTLGERMAAKVLQEDARYFHLNDTGVFYRQQ